MKILNHPCLYCWEVIDVTFVNIVRLYQLDLQEIGYFIFNCCEIVVKTCFVHIFRSVSVIEFSIYINVFLYHTVLYYIGLILS